MKQSSTFFLKGVVSLIGLGVLALCVVVLPRLITAELSGDFDYAPILIGLYLPAIPFFVGVHQTLKLLGYIENNQAFSQVSVKTLKHIKYAALAISAIFTVSMPYTFYIADRDDAPGLVAMWFVMIFASIVVATAGAVFQKLLQNAVDLKSENDLTV